MRYISLVMVIAMGVLMSQGAPKRAKSKVNPAALYQEAKEAYMAYDFELAGDKLDEAEKELRRTKKEIPDEYEDFRSRILMGKNMLDRVEKIQIIDSLLVDRDDFFKYYKLSSEAGKLMSGKILPSSMLTGPVSVVYEPQSNKEVFWAMPTRNGGRNHLVSASILDDGTFEAPVAVGEELGEGGDADYLYFMPDGVTFYFANNGDDSLGGYDIFLSRRQPDGSVPQPQNIGMPYNSPYDDYMLVIDEAAGLGWWATDRKQIEDKVTIYTFVYNDVRQNYSADDPDLADYARITSIAATQDGSVNAHAMLSNPILHQSEEAVAPAAATFKLYLPNGKVYTQLADFRNSQARSAMQQYLDRQKDYDMMQAQLRIMRQKYSSGDKTVGKDILSLEKRILAAQPMLRKLRNQAIAAEK